MLKLHDVTLVAMGSTNIEGNIKALEYSCRGVAYDSVKFITDAPISHSFIKVCHIDKISSIDQWNHDVVYKLGGYIDTAYFILVHPDGFVVNPNSWTDEFLNYDYVGAPWPLPTDDYSYRDELGNIVRVGNSVSIRSKKLADLPRKLNLEWREFYGNTNEDGFFCCHHKKTLEAHGCKFAPIEIAKYFSREVEMEENKHVFRPFAFHKHAGTNKDYPNFE